MGGINRIGTPNSSVDAGNFLSTYLLNTSGSDNNLGIDASSSATTFAYTVASGKELELGRMLIYLETSSAMSSTTLGHLTSTTASAGVAISINGTAVTTWLDNIDIVASMYDVADIGAIFGKTTNTLTGRWTFYKATGDASGVFVSAGNTVQAVINDDLSQFPEFRLRIQGLLRNAA